uniref:hypothetical protein n=1 Tax=Serratia grimesii TaxID=82995 RepID=UPI001F4C0F83|nr:hypothetical protein [Serratia grimesii]
MTGTGYQLTMQGRDRKPHAQANDQRERVRTGEDAGEANPCVGGAPAQGQSRGRTPCAEPGLRGYTRKGQAFAWRHQRTTAQAVGQ